jgi:hypothetical protein
MAPPTVSKEDQQEEEERRLQETVAQQDNQSLGQWRRRQGWQARHEAAPLAP